MTARVRSLVAGVQRVYSDGTIRHYGRAMARTSASSAAAAAAAEDRGTGLLGQRGQHLADEPHVLIIVGVAGHSFASNCCG
ncbi:hypothetical protein [Nonomuraea zeae]|uniref:Uncharacterized protein n=1 Tax=Nonomuraea zeae TaxID=1642303 RepID=A0A5S4GTT1_9ACTN|nr:hypothetical protein [Nonomuraea zeae]TMR35884.1 hypothetical protein ETD85_12455 [Nonomuraea zeae]